MSCTPTTTADVAACNADDVDARLQRLMPENCMLQRFLIVATAAPMVRIGPHVAQCRAYRPPQSPAACTPSQLRWGEDNTEVVNDDALYTWSPQQRIPLLLCKITEYCTALFVCETESFFYANNVSSLPLGTPTGTVLAGVYTEDERDAVKLPRILVNDCLHWGQGVDDWRQPYSEDLTTTAAAERYRVLRERFGTLLQKVETESCIVLQWLGYRAAARRFLALPGREMETIAVGHKVGGLLVVHQKSALCPALVRE